MGIQDPDLTTVSFGYDASFANRLTSRTDRRGTVTTYAFDAGNKVAQASINMGTGQAAINTTLTALESRGLPGSSTPSSVDTAVANSRFNGARTDVGDTTLFWLDRFGAPRKIVDALGNATLLNRGDARWPALVTRLQYPSGQVTGATYDTLRGKDRKSTRLNSSHGYISYAVFCLKKKRLGDYEQDPDNTVPGSDKTKIILTIDITALPTAHFSHVSAYSSADSALRTLSHAQNKLL